MTRGTAAFLLVLSGAPAWGQGGGETAGDDLAHGRIRYVEPGIAVQRSDEPATEEAMPNTPFLPGDRVWSDGSGRAELQFPDGSAVRLDRRSKLDYLEHEAGRDELVVLSLWSGSVYLRVRDDRGHADFVIETPDGRVEVREPGNYRVDVEDETRLRVYDGQARLESGRRSVQAESGETAAARRGEAPSRAVLFDTDEADDEFARWDEQRGSVAWQADSLRYLPEEVQPYASDFDTYGQWHYEAEVGNVWRPRVAAGWRPYSDGRWTWTSYGWTWVPFEPWGWAPSHYGRWGHSVSLGWYWIPGRQWGPAWVSWRTGGDYVGWCALGRGDRPAVDLGSHRGYAAHGTDTRAAGTRGGNPWFYARRADMGTRDGARRRVELDSVTAAQAAPVDGRLRLNRDLRAVEHIDGVALRSPRTRATGNLVPELRYDPLTTLPPAASRRRPASEGRRDPRTDSGSAGRAPEASAPAEQRQPSRRDAWDPERRRSTGSSSGGSSIGSAGDGAPAAIGSSTSPEREQDPAAERARRAPAGDPDVLRHFFTPLVEPRGETARTRRERGTQDEGERQPARSESGSERRAPQHATPRQEPAREPAAQATPAPSSESRAARRQPKKDHDDR